MPIFEGEFVRDTEKAICLRTEDGVDHWIPRSVIDAGEIYVEGENVAVEVPQWFWDKAGLY